MMPSELFAISLSFTLLPVALGLWLLAKESDAGSEWFSERNDIFGERDVGKWTILVCWWVEVEKNRLEAECDATLLYRPKIEIMAGERRESDDDHSQAYWWTFSLYSMPIFFVCLLFSMLCTQCFQTTVVPVATHCPPAYLFLARMAFCSSSTLLCMCCPANDDLNQQFTLSFPAQSLRWVEETRMTPRDETSFLFSFRSQDQASGVRGRERNWGVSCAPHGWV